MKPSQIDGGAVVSTEFLPSYNRVCIYSGNLPKMEQFLSPFGGLFMYDFLKIANYKKLKRIVEKKDINPLVWI